MHRGGCVINNYIYNKLSILFNHLNVHNINSQVLLLLSIVIYLKGMLTAKICSRNNLLKMGARKTAVAISVACVLAYAQGPLD
jgi:hypothetical protein